MSLAGTRVISRYDDVRSVLKRAELFSSDAMGTVLIGAQPGTKPGQSAADADALQPLPAGYFT